VGVQHGEPGQVFHLQNAPISAESRRDGRSRRMRDGSVYVPGVCEGTVAIRIATIGHLPGYGVLAGELWAVIRQRDGTVRQYGRRSGSRSPNRFSQYRHGGGVPERSGRQAARESKRDRYIDSVSNCTGRRGAGSRNARGGQAARTTRNAPNSGRSRPKITKTWPRAPAARSPASNATRPATVRAKALCLPAP